MARAFKRPRNLGGNTESRQQFAPDLIDLILKRFPVEFGADYDRVVDRRRHVGGRLVVGKGIRPGWRLQAPWRRHADDVLVGGARGFQVALRLDAVGSRAGQAGFGLVNIGAGDFTDLKTVAGRFKLALQDLFVVDVELEDGFVPENVQKCRRRVEQHVLLGL